MDISVAIVRLPAISLHVGGSPRKRRWPGYHFTVRANDPEIYLTMISMEATKSILDPVRRLSAYSVGCLTALGIVTDCALPH